MDSLLKQLNSVPGVVGSMLCDAEGGLLAQAFPPLFDGAMLKSAAAVLADGAAGLQTVTGQVGMLDLRYGESRIVVRSLGDAHLLLLCAAQTNLQLLNISMSVAVPKIQKLVAARPSSPPAGDEVVGDAEVVEDESLTGYERAFVKVDGWLRRKAHAEAAPPPGAATPAPAEAEPMDEEEEIPVWEVPPLP